MEIKTGQNLYNAIDKICGFTALEDDMMAIIEAIKQDNPDIVKNNVDLANVRQQSELLKLKPVIKPPYNCPSEGECIYPNCKCEWKL